MKMGRIAVTHGRVLTASLVGTSVEFYDFNIYATAATLVFGGLFFPAGTPSLQLLAAYGSFAVAFFARPVGVPSCSAISAILPVANRPWWPRCWRAKLRRPCRWRNRCGCTRAKPSPPLSRWRHKPWPI
jgi:hypothetical protein